MNSSSKQFFDLAKAVGGLRDPGFEQILVFDFYDGPEKGLAIYPSGEGLRFSSLGESTSRRFRAFEFAAIQGNWKRQVEFLRNTPMVGSPGRLLFPAIASDELSILEREVLGAEVDADFVGVGLPYLDKLIISSVSPGQLEIFRGLKGQLESYNSVHRLIKANRRID
jgi:hypothetical protein